MVIEAGVETFTKGRYRQQGLTVQKSKIVMSDSNKSDGLLGGMIIGAAIGAIAGILAAPRTGRDTRRILKKSADALPELAEDLATSIQFQADRLSDTSLQNWEQTLVRLREAISAGRSAGRLEWERQTSSDLQGGHPTSGPSYDEPYLASELESDSARDVDADLNEV